jgi:DNA helicase-2/ATP-dependent DNA helicase PcrA
MTDLLSALNPNQKMAVRTVDGPVLIVAGAGTGKTRTLVYRLAYLATEASIPPEKLLP